MNDNEPPLGRYANACPQCKLGTPVRWRNDTKEWIHENIRTNDATRTTAFSQVYCLATPLRIEDNG